MKYVYLPESIKTEFKEQCHWVLSKTGQFSAIRFDQAHEQENKTIKGSGCAVGLTGNPTGFRRWMLSGPDMARLLTQFEGECLPADDPDTCISTNQANHEQGLATQRTFQGQANRLLID